MTSRVDWVVIIFLLPTMYPGTLAKATGPNISSTVCLQGYCFSFESRERAKRGNRPGHASDNGKDLSTPSTRLAMKLSSGREYS